MTRRCYLVMARRDRAIGINIVLPRMTRSSRVMTVEGRAVVSRTGK
jgi:hypothetical protein